MSNQEENGVQISVEELWYLKDITFRLSSDSPPKQVKIVTQNFNGPCSFIAICNILILRGQIQILPAERTSVSYDFLSHLVGEWLLAACPDVDTSAALSMMPITRSTSLLPRQFGVLKLPSKGMDLNPLFTNVTSFRPAGAGGELKLFEQAGIKLVHGWLVDPASPEHQVLAKTEDYDTSINLLVEADHLTKGKLVTTEHFTPASPTEPSPEEDLSPEDFQKIEDGEYLHFLSRTPHKTRSAAIVIRNFIESTQSQLTYYGLFALASSLEPGSLVALFRNSHLSVLFKAPGEEAALYTLVTDQVFLHEASVVWERLEDVDGGWSTFVDSDFVRSSPAGGDYAGHTGESALAALEAQAAGMTIEDDADQQLARRLQAEEDQRAQEIYEQRTAERSQREREALRRLPAPEHRQKKKKTDCVVM
ncbi:hypothetical protein BKA93DRAFT_828155 [Sparassis latifolia]